VKRHNPSPLSSFLATVLALAPLLCWLDSPSFGAQDAAAARADEQIAEVRVQGNRSVATQKIMAEIRTRAGTPPDRKLIEEDVRRLVATRQFFDVGVEFLREPHGLVVLFRVLEGNQIRDIAIEGNRAISTDKLREKAGLKPEKDKSGTKSAHPGTFDISRSKDAARTMEDLYHEKGYPFARVTVVEGSEPGDKRLVFRVVEGPKVAITDVDFVFLDTDTLGARLLATKIKSKPRKFGFYGGKYNAREIDEDVQRLSAYYRSLGFFDAKVSREPRESDDRSKVNVIFVIQEGPQYHVRSIVFKGNEKLPNERLTEGMKLKIGEPFNQAKFQQDSQKVKDKYGALGHIEATDGGGLKINPDVRFLDEPGQVDVVYHITEGEPYYVGRIFITGNHTTRDNVIRSQIRIYPGEVLDTTMLRRSEANLRKTQLFLANFQQGTGPSLTPMGEGPNLRDIKIDVQEAQTGRILFGVGVNSDAGLLGNIIISEQNFDITRFPASVDDVINGDAFRGGGEEFRLEAAPGTQFSRYLASWRDPNIFDLPYSLGVSGHFFQRNYREWDEERLGGTITVGHSFTDQIRASLGLRAEEVNVDNPDLPTPPELVEVLGDNFLTTVSLGLEHDTRDNPFMATCGHLTSVNFEQGFGDFTYSQVTLEGRQYFAITERPDGSGKQVFSLRGTVGFTSNDTPIFERFFAGGFRNFRGFRFRGVGPVGSNNDEIHVGGDFMLLGSAEYQFPITADDTLQMVFFSDFGTVEENIEISEFRATAGLGLRVVVPMLGPVPLAFDFAFPVAMADTDETQVFSFFVGFFR
jgi:outer membrane protein assembly complex protein YaeT